MIYCFFYWCVSCAELRKFAEKLGNLNLNNHLSLLLKKKTMSACCFESNQTFHTWWQMTMIKTDINQRMGITSCWILSCCAIIASSYARQFKPVRTQRLHWLKITWYVHSYWLHPICCYEQYNTPPNHPPTPTRRSMERDHSKSNDIIWVVDDSRHDTDTGMSVLHTAVLVVFLTTGFCVSFLANCSWPNSVIAHCLEFHMHSEII